MGYIIESWSRKIFIRGRVEPETYLNLDFCKHFVTFSHIPFRTSLTAVVGSPLTKENRCFSVVYSMYRYPYFSYFCYLILNLISPFLCICIAFSYCNKIDNPEKFSNSRQIVLSVCVLIVCLQFFSYFKTGSKKSELFSFL